MGKATPVMPLGALIDVGPGWWEIPTRKLARIVRVYTRPLNMPKIEYTTTSMRLAIFGGATELTGTGFQKQGHSKESCRGHNDACCEHAQNWLAQEPDLSINEGW
jgi:hypothetical protein